MSHSNKNIGFNKPYVTGKENIYINEAIEKSKISGNGDFTKKCQNFFEKTKNAQTVKHGNCLEASLTSFAVNASHQCRQFNVALGNVAACDACAEDVNGMRFPSRIKGQFT